MKILSLCVIAVVPVLSFAGELASAEELSFKAAFDGSAQLYCQMLPKPFDAEKPHDVLIALHGHGLSSWQCINSQFREFKAAQDFAAAHGMIYISPYYRDRTSWMGPAAEADVVQIIALLRQKYKVGRAFLTGASTGGASVLIFTVLHPDLVPGVSSQNGTANMVEYENFQDAIAASYGGDKKQKPDEYKKRSAELVPEKFTMPVAFAVGGKDSTVPPDSVRRLAEKLAKQNPKKVLMLDRKDGGHPTTYEDTMESLEFMLKAAKP